MKTLGNVVHIQRGETWSLDFDVTNVNGAPYMLFKEWRHPYLVITVTAARYEQKGDFRQTWWLDMDQRYVEQADGSFRLVPMKRFIETQPLYTQYHMISQVMSTYGEPFGKITATGNKSDPFDVTNYLFFTDNNADGNNSYKYVSDYTVGHDSFTVTEVWYQTAWNPDEQAYTYIYPEWGIYYGSYPAGTRVRYNDELYAAIDDVYSSEGPPPDNPTIWINLSPYSNMTFHELYNPHKEYVRGDIVIKNDNKGYIYTGVEWHEWLELTGYYSDSPYIESETWEEYNFRIIKQFNTKSWTEQNYLFDMKVLAGETIAEHVEGILVEQGLSDFPVQPWTDEITNQQIKRITDRKKRKEMQELQDSGVPLMPDFDTKSLILEPTKLIVSANIQGGVR